MMKYNGLEVFSGFVVILMAAFLFLFAYRLDKVSIIPRIQYSAEFDKIDGLIQGNDVKMGGVKVGKVLSTSVNPISFRILVHLEVNRDLKIPADSRLIVSSESLFGGKYITISPGGRNDQLAPGGRFIYTQSSISFEEILGKYLLSQQQSSK